MKYKMLFLALLLMGCGHTDESGQLGVVKQQDSVIGEFENANKLLDNGKYDEAARAYDLIITKYPTNQIDILVLFNSGLAHLQSLRCETAIDRFRQVVRKSTNKMSAFRPRALIRLGDAYVCTGDDSKAIVTLIEAFKLRRALPPEVGLAELPARLAAAYARLGNGKEAARYFEAAEEGLRRISASAGAPAEKERLAQTLYLMGNVSHLAPGRMPGDDYFSTLKALQKYLFKAVEYNVKSWSELAADQLKTAYENAWTYIDGVVVENSDPMIAERERKLEQLRIAQMAMESLRGIYHERVPDPSEPESVSRLMDELNKHDRRLRNYIAKNIVGTSLTPEALQAESVKKMGKVYNPDPILEEISTKKPVEKKVK